VLFVGQMVQRKGLWYLLEAWRRLALPNAELVLAGRGNRDQQMLAKFEGQYQIRTTMTIQVLAELYQSSHLLCVPSLVEGFGQVFLESLACGTPVIATPHTGVADSIRNGEEGFIVNVRSVDELMERLEWAYTHRAELSLMRAKARRLAEGFTWKAFRNAVAAQV
jgi:glycosyltransferase involved in cell wall biosynthesis